MSLKQAIATLDHAMVGGHVSSHLARIGACAIDEYLRAQMRESEQLSATRVISPERAIQRLVQIAKTAEPHHQLLMQASALFGFCEGTCFEEACDFAGLPSIRFLRNIRLKKLLNAIREADVLASSLRK